MSGISTELKRFILTSIPSVPHMEAALLMHAQPAVRHSAAEIASRLYVPDQKAAEVLRALCAAGILHCDDAEVPRYWFEPGKPVLDGLLAALARAYAADLTGVTELIHDATQKNARRFANAFKLRRHT
jgi:hypothetical protein